MTRRFALKSALATVFAFQVLAGTQLALADDHGGGSASEPRPGEVSVVNAEAGMETEAPEVTQEIEETAEEQAGIAEGSVSSIEKDEAAGEEEGPGRKKVNLIYYSILYGPGLKNPSRFQPSSRGGVPDRDRPVQLRNFLGLALNLSDQISVIPTGSFTWEADGDQKVTVRDPFLRISHNSIINTDYLNLYGDVRFHFPVTNLSRENDLLAGVQTFQALTWQVGASPWAVTLFGSLRYNYFGKQGFGNDLEAYVAPYVAYQLRHNLSLTLLYEVEGSHFFGNAPGRFENHGADIEPGLSWEIAPSFVVNPYLNFYPSDGFSLNSASFGMTLYWSII